MEHLPARSGEARERQLRRGGDGSVRQSSGNLREDILTLPTPKARDAQAEGYEAGLRQSSPQVGTIVKGLVEGDERVLMPTPTTRDYKDGSAEHERDGVVQTDTVARAIFNSGEVLLPTATASDWKGANHSGSGSAISRGIATVSETLLPTLRASDGYERRNQKTMDKIAAEGGDMTMVTLARTQTDWGKFEPAIRRWEETIGRPAPAPTKPDGKDQAHRLSSKFTEWMMGLPDGWVTDSGLSRNDELKMCGNGVVPQQAELALRVLLEGITLPSGGGK